ncbi:histidine phosphatase superfamily [Scenedesmus sp. NREL 46B-D3]|nr:histidine phosphatase superfamily [Scenedesmus sp. NREL 46B-D3]
MAATTELVLIRHGETDWNKEHRLQGQAKPGPPLNDMGLQQTHMLCHVLQKRYDTFDAVVSSDLQRTLQTAHILAAPYQLQVQQHAGLRERHIGLLQGLSSREAPLQQPRAWAALQSGDCSARIPGCGESLDDLGQRLSVTLLEIAARHPGKRVLVISHGGALHATHRAARGYGAQGKVSNCSISVVTVELDSQPDASQDPKHQRQGQPDTCKDPQDQPGRQPGVPAWLDMSACSSSTSSSTSTSDSIMHSSLRSSLQSSFDIHQSMHASEALQNVGGVQQPGLELDLLFSSAASQGSAYCSSSCCGCCYCMGDVREGDCRGGGGVALSNDADGEEGAAAAGQQEEWMLVKSQQQQQQQQHDCEVAVMGEDGFWAAAAAAAAAAAEAAKAGLIGKALSGKLSMLVWNDTAALYDLEAEEGVGMRAAGFGGSAREA